MVTVTEVAEAALALSQASPCFGLGDLAEVVGARAGEVGAVLSSLSGAVSLEGGEVCVGDRVALALRAVELGADPAKVSDALTWRDFEAFAASALEEAGFEVARNVRASGRGGFEVDVVGSRPPLAVAIDCKRWSYRASSPSRIAEAAARHRRRAERLAASWPSLGLPARVRTLVPALLVLREDLPREVAGVAVVPASRLRGFLEELEAVAAELGIRVTGGAGR